MSNNWKQLGLVVLLALLGSSMEKSGIGQYRFPMNGSEFLLSGTFGELRTNHFHSGIDIKTGGEIGRPLYAAREGYVYRIKVSPYGFGKAIYLRHPDGQFTVYAHMDRFSESIEDFIYTKQYASKRYEQEVYLPEEEMPVRKGELIGYSGNSGSSQGPHLHFEIRDPDERITNVLQHYRSTISDRIPPIVQTIGFQALDASSRVNGQFEKFTVTPSGSNGDYEIPGTIELLGRVGLEYHAYDLLSGAPNHCGINYARLYLDGKQIYGFELDAFSFDEKKYINVHFDYPYYQQHRQKFQKAYLDDGNRLDAYPVLDNRGTIELKDRAVHQLRLELEDTHGNVTRLRARLKQGQANELPSTVRFDGLTSLSGYPQRDAYVCRVENPSTTHLRGLDVVFHSGEVKKLMPSHLEGNVLVYLLEWDKWRLPQEIRDPLTGKSLALHFRETILPDKNNIVEQGELQAYFPYTAVFDTLPLHIQRFPGGAGMFSDIYEIGSTDIPLFKSFVMNFRPSRPGNPTHMVVARKNRSGNWSFLGQDINEDGSIYASSSSFGTFCVMADSIPPTIRPLNIGDGATVTAGQNTLRLKVTDNFAGINSEKVLCTLDDNWELFEFDAKSSTLTHRLKERPAPGRHRLHVMVYDNANNLAESTFYLYF